MRSRSFTSQNPNGSHRLHFTEWGDPDAPAVLCLHGLTQTARSFDTLAQALAPERRVICLDVVGRGESDWLADPMGYDFVQYVTDALGLLGHLELDGVDVVGTSMGGMIGMFMAARTPAAPPPGPVRKLVLNDVGPFVPKEAVARIRDYVGTDPDFADVAEYEAYLRVIWAPFGALTDTQWRHLAETSARTNESGRIAPAYDPDIRVPMMAAPPEDADLWAFWDTITAPTLVLRGAQSDILPADLALEMSQRGPRAQIVAFDNVGHAPALMADDQIEAVAAFLNA